MDFPDWGRVGSRAAEFLAYARAQLLQANNGAAARAYLHSERGIDAETSEAFQLGLNPKSWKNVRFGDELCFIPAGIVIPRFYEGELRALKIRRPQPDDLLWDYFSLIPGTDVDFEGYKPVGGHSPSCAGASTVYAKYQLVRGSVPGLFGRDLWRGHETLLLVEGEFDAMLCWRVGRDVCDVASFGSASQAPAEEEEIEMLAYERILVVYDDDEAGRGALRRFERLKRARFLEPPAHDLTDFWRGGGDLRGWIEITFGD